MTPSQPNRKRPSRISESSEEESGEVESVIDQMGTPSIVSAPDSGFDLKEFRESEDGKKLVAWAKDQYGRCRSQKSRKHEQWYLFMSFYFGHQWVDIVTNGMGAELAGKIKARPVPPYMQKRTVNRIRSFVRTEQSKFLSTLPTVSAVPATSEEEDVRAAYAAEQAWQSYLAKNKLRREYSRANWWKIITGNGFIKSWWDPTVIDKSTGQPGDIVYRSVSPFHIFVPDQREREVDDQPFIIQAQVKPLEWCRQQYPEELDGEKLEPSQSSANSLLDDAYYKLAGTPKSELDACLVLEVWVKPGTNKMMPQGGLLVLIEDVLVGAYMEGMPYNHGEYPYTKIEHLSNDTFWADSPLADLVELQREFNETRTQISLAARRMGNPQLLAQQGSIVPGRMTNEPGQQILYRPGTPPPQPIPLQPLPEYVVGQLDRIIQDFEDLSGQHEVSKGHTPTGVTAGTALAFLKETDDNYLTPQYQNIEDAFERIAKHTLMLFQQFVDVPRKLKVIGADGAFDTALLSGADISGATDIRVEPGSSIGQSMAAKRAAVMDMFSVGILQDPNQALRLLEVGGAQKVLDTVSVAEKKAQRENTKIKSLNSEEGMAALQEHMQQNLMEMVQVAAGQMNEEAQATGGIDPETGEPAMPVDPMQMMQDPQIMQMLQEQIPPMIPADDFDMHEVHIDVHNRYRMGQEYETLPDEIKAEFDKHVQMHEMLLQQKMMEQMMMGGGMPMDPAAGDQGGAPLPEQGGPANIGQDPAAGPVQ